MMEKVERDGKVAVLYSPGYGAGWSTWAADDQKEAMCMDARIVAPFLTKGAPAAMEAAEKLFPDMYLRGGEALKVEWVEKGTAFYIKEYDGSESIILMTDRDVFVT
jgi:hypothetical protein